ncbi:MAG TPA: metal-dependent hydrolase [Candidatus Binatus sp.]|nr:metal-dependent hydrolase [Candidatus Binatus sp.]
MSDSTSTSELGVTVTPRRPGFDFAGLEHTVPRAWHPDGIGATAFLEALSAMAPVVEAFFVEDARGLLPRIADDALRAEGGIVPTKGRVDGIASYRTPATAAS